jgi:hypothetical protein
MGFTPRRPRLLERCTEGSRRRPTSSPPRSATSSRSTRPTRYCACTRGLVGASSTPGSAILSTTSPGTCWRRHATGSRTSCASDPRNPTRRRSRGARS